MRRSLPVLCWLTWIWPVAAQSGNQIRITVKAERGIYLGATAVVENGSKFPMTALSLAVSGGRLSVRGGTVRVNGSSNEAERPPLSVFDSAIHRGSALEAGGKLRVRLPVDPSGQVRVAAAVLADGETYGDPSQIQAVLALRRSTLQALPIVIRYFPAQPPPPGVVCVMPGVPVGLDPRGVGDPGMNPMPEPGEDVDLGGGGVYTAPSLPTSMRDCQSIERSSRGVPDFMSTLRASLLGAGVDLRNLALINAILRVHSEIQREAFTMRGASPKKILAKLTIMLHVWQEELQSSLPSLSAAP